MAGVCAVKELVEGCARARLVGAPCAQIQAQRHHVAPVSIRQVCVVGVDTGDERAHQRLDPCLVLGVGVGVAVGVGVGVGSTGLNTGIGDGFGAALTATPLFQISFLPDLIQVNFLLPTIDVVFNLLQAPPALTAAKVWVLGAITKQAVSR